MRGRNAVDIGEDDIKRSLDKLKALGRGFALIEVNTGGSGSKTRKMIVSVPTELNQDHTTVISVATRRCERRGPGESYVSIATMKEECGWAAERTLRALKLLEREGMVWRDDCRKRQGGGGGENLFWFPSVFGAGVGEAQQG